MRIRSGTIFVVVIAHAVGAAAGWFAEGIWNGMGQSPRAARWSAPTDSPRARSMNAPEKPKVTDAGLAALRDKAASLDKELKELLAARERKAKADAQKAGGGDSQKDKPEVSADEALEKCETYGELKRRYPNVWREWHGKMSVHATRVLKKYDSWRGYMSGLDVSSMTDEERENHTRMMEIYEKKHALMRETELCADDEMTVARFKENRDEMERLDEEGRKLMVAERNTLLRITAENLGRRLGWQDADTAEFAETLSAVGDVVSGDTIN